MILMDGAWVPEVFAEGFKFFSFFVFKQFFKIQSFERVKLLLMRLAKA